MQITNDSLTTNTGLSEWFTGAVYIDTITTPSEGSRLTASSVHFTPGARTAWHTRPNGQTKFRQTGLE
jgi:quercetin dioxygenase-like cupin family protein